MTIDVLSILYLVGGLALFIYGMSVMGGGLERAAGAQLEKTLEKMTGNIFTSMLMGIAVTAVIQSSSATTVMVVGFVNAGIMSLRQSVGVILGANIGTTITAQILRLDSAGTFSGSLLMQLLKPNNLAYVAVLAGIVLQMMAKKKRQRDIADILIGFGILFIGMSTMELAVSPLADLPQFRELFAAISNPILGVLVGALVTAIIQSSSASVGILQALSTTGAITYAAAIPIILGQNIGTCVTAFLSSVGASKNARRTAMIHFYFNLIGSIVFLLAIYGLHAVIPFSFWDQAINKGGIANFHTLFNVSVTLLFLPFSQVLVWLAERTIPTQDEKPDPLARLDPRFLSTPSLAFEQCQKCIGEMGQAAKENFLLVSNQIFANATPDAKEFKEREAFLDRAEVEIGKYLVSMQGNLPEGGRHMHAEMMHALSDFEKLGDYAQNMMESYTEFHEAGQTFSEKALEELQVMCSAVEELITLTIEGYIHNSADIAQRVEPIEEVVDYLKDVLTNRHIDRLNAGTCTVVNGITFLELVHDLEKIGDHCSNIAIYTIQLAQGVATFNTHGYAKNALKNIPVFREELFACQAKYLQPLGLQLPQDL